MIAWMRGVLREKQPPWLLVDTDGIGYEMEAPMTTFYDLPEIGQSVMLYLHHTTREDAEHLYAFTHRAERDMFRQLLRVNGVGAKLGLAILSGMDATRFMRCVREDDTVSLLRLPGIGKKTAQRIVMELRDKVDTASAGTTIAGVAGVGPAPPRHDPIAEAVSALIALGLKPPEANRRVHAIETHDLSCEEIIRRALQAMVQ